MGRIEGGMGQHKRKGGPGQAPIARLRPHPARGEDEAWGIQEVPHHRHQVLALREEGDREAGEALGQAGAALARPEQRQSVDRDGPLEGVQGRRGRAHGQEVGRVDGPDARLGRAQ